MSIDKFGHHINSYNRHQYRPYVEDLGYNTYKLLLRFTSDKIDPKTKKYILFQTNNDWEFLLDRGTIRHIRAYPERVVIMVNEKRYFVEEMENIILENKDIVSFIGVENEHLFVEMVVECPISFQSFIE